MSMRVKLEIEAGRVKSLCFHDKRPWLLASFHSGEIIIYDFEVGIEIQRYTEYTVPVRTAAFHPSLPYFAAGADDATIKIFNYDDQRCIATFTDHLDYIRTVQFHSTRPYLISASDDQSIRIWNYETKTCVTSISGHNHYVMSAFFHPTLPLIISASLDDTVRVWDISALFNETGGASGLFSITDAVIKFSQEDHMEGVNWAAWHPSKPLAISCSDDESVKIWRVTENEMSIIATLRSHTGNISCATFIPNMDCVVSCSEDNTVRIWDSKRFIHLNKYKRDGDRFWTVAAHPNLPIFAAGHDSGLTIFLMKKCQPAFQVSNDSVFYYNNQSIREFQINNNSDEIVANCKPRAIGSRSSPLDPKPSHLTYNPDQKKFLVGFIDKYELHQVNESQSAEPLVLNGHNPIWISRAQYAYLDEKPNTIYVNEVQGKNPTAITVPNPIKNIYQGPTGTVFISNDDTVMRFDINRQKSLASTNLLRIKKVFVSPNKKLIALYNSTFVYITDLNFSNIVSVQEVNKIKSGYWYDDDAFVYSTRTHVKYVLRNGDSGTIRSFPRPIYIAAIAGNKLVYIDRDDVIKTFEIDTLEIRFKTAIMENRLDAVVTALRGAKVCSNTIIDYLHKRGYPEIAVQFVTDPHSKFDLAIESGNLELAIDAANEINEATLWDRLADEALSQGKLSIAESAFKKSGNMERLAFLYLISGQTQKLNALKIDESLALQRAIWSNDRTTESFILHDVAPALGFIAASEDQEDSFNLQDDVKEELSKFKVGELSAPQPPKNPLFEDWPTLYVARPKYTITPSAPQQDDADEEGDQDGWAFDDDDEDNKANKKAEEDSEDGWDIDDNDVPVPENVEEEPQQTGFRIPTPGHSPTSIWTDNCDIPAHFAAAGDFATALQLLQEQIALANAEPLREHMISCYVASHVSIPAVACAAPIITPLTANFLKRKAPMPSFSIERMERMMHEGFDHLEAFRYPEAKEKLQKVLQSLALASVSTLEEQQKVTSAIAQCRAHITAAIIGEACTPADKGTYFAYMASLPNLEEKIQAKFSVRAIRTAITLHCYKTANILAERIINRNHIPKKYIDGFNAQLAKIADKNKDEIDINFNPSAARDFDICCEDLTQFKRGTTKVSCPFCHASYSTNHAGKLCKVCELSKIGCEATGLRICK